MTTVTCCNRSLDSVDFFEGAIGVASSLVTPTGLCGESIPHASPAPTLSPGYPRGRPVS